MKCVIFGSAGFAKEVDWLLNEVIENGDENKSAPAFFVGRDNLGTTINGVEVISDEQFFSGLTQSDSIETYLAIGSPNVRKKIFQQLESLNQIRFPKILHPSIKMDKRNGKVEIGDGTIICAGVVITTDVSIGAQVQINLNCTIGHDTKIGDFCTLSPGVHVSGNVNMGQSVFVGTGAVILERLSIVDNVTIGAGSVVTKSITEPGIYVGIPAKKMSK